ncbi:clathrin light chain A-like [Physella acuta]|uniref:clathrin light chain A-like n=1 Tax=Physella acuta TaxID=109671 RepID=UPI0027DD9409|nr:clathrin light chain A-like [Physella acuta]
MEQQLCVSLALILTNILIFLSDIYFSVKTETSADSQIIVYSPTGLQCLIVLRLQFCLQPARAKKLSPCYKALLSVYVISGEDLWEKLLGDVFQCGCLQANYHSDECVDPAADFLAREQSELAGLEDDNFGEGQQFTQDFDGFAQNQEQVTVAQSNGPSNMYEAISQQDTIRAVPEKIKIWREEQKTRLEKKDSEEAKRKKELKEKAKKELDDWYKHHTEQLEKTKENNRAAETAFVKDRDEKVTGQAWEKITRLCEFNPKNSKNTKDVSRFRSILLQLKQTPLVR